MHVEAADALMRFAKDHSPSWGSRGLELGSRDLNGSLQVIFPSLEWTGLDLTPGHRVDIVADAAEWRGIPESYDVVLCTEVFEHTPKWGQIVQTAWWHLRTGGLLLCSCAAEPRKPHSADDGGLLRLGEYYGNVEKDDLEALLARNFAESGVEFNMAAHGGDLYGWAVK